MRWIVVGVLAIAAPVHADELPTVTLGASGPDREIPVGSSFYLQGEAAPSIATAQVVVVRKGSSGLFGSTGPDCGSVVDRLHVDVTGRSAADEDDDLLAPPPLDASARFAFEAFPHADRELREAPVIVSAAWERSDAGAKQYKVLVPRGERFYTPGHGYCLFVVTTERRQELDDQTIVELVDGLGKKIVACGDRSSCEDDALADYEARVERMLSGSRSVLAGPVGEARELAHKLEEAARVELGTATGIIEARDHIQDRWKTHTAVMQPLAHTLWADIASDPLAHVVATLLARSAALLPQVRGTGVALYTTDGRLAVGSVQILDDARSIRVGTSKSPTGDQARVLTATTDMLPVADELSLYDLIELGAAKVRVDKTWIGLDALGDRVGALGLDEWSAEDTAFLAAATAQMKRLSELVDDVTTGAACAASPIPSIEPEHTTRSVHRHLGEWLMCQHVDAASLAELAQLLAELGREDRGYQAAKENLVKESQRIVTVTTTAPSTVRIGFESTTWVFSYLTPMLGYATTLRSNESFSLFYVGVELHFDPNPVDDVLWSHGVTAKDLRRAIALEIAVAPTTDAFGPDNRFSGVRGLPPIYLGIAAHVLPYTSIAFGGVLVDRKRSTLAAEDPHVAFEPYLGLAVQLNLPDLFRYASHPSSNTTVIP